MIKPAKHKLEEARLKALYNYNILDTPSEQRYDDITLLASHICQTPTALISFVDDERQWFKSRIGMPVAETPRDEAFCAHAIHNTDLFIVPDSLKDDRFHDNPLVTGPAQVRFYAGAPLMDSDGLPLGTLCVMDKQPRALTDDQKNALNALARQVISQLELRGSMSRLQESLSRIKEMQTQIIMQEKLASLGSLTAGIAHEIKNPLNFVNNFSRLTLEMVDELSGILTDNTQSLPPDSSDDINELLQTIQLNISKIHEHGKRADSIVKNMLMHSRDRSGQHQPVNINQLIDENVHLAYHGIRANNNSFNVTLNTDYDPSLPLISVIPQDFSRVILNIMNNACYAADKKKLSLGASFSPEVKISTKLLPEAVEIKIRDNGFGIPEDIAGKIFTPFFTTKPAGEGTGLGLSMSYDIIVQQHNGTLSFNSSLGDYSEFIITLPL